MKIPLDIHKSRDYGREDDRAARYMRTRFVITSLNFSRGRLFGRDRIGRRRRTVASSGARAPPENTCGAFAATWLQYEETDNRKANERQARNGRECFAGAVSLSHRKDGAAGRSRAPRAADESSMAKKMLIDATHPEETRVVVMDGTRIDEFDFESINKRQLAGNIYLAKVTRVE
ncbi:MAG: hypothetical protein ACK5MQ_07910, partial [Pikeienuella sp.]